MAAEPRAPHLPEEDRLLRRAAELIAVGWCQRALALDRSGRQVAPWDGDARRWSPLGALLRAWYERGAEGIEPFGVAYVALALATGGRVSEWNDAPWRTLWHVSSALVRAREFLPEARRRTRELSTVPERDGRPAAERSTAPTAL